MRVREDPSAVFISPISQIWHIFALVDCRSLYVSYLEIYTMKQPDGPFAIINKTKDLEREFIIRHLEDNLNLPFKIDDETFFSVKNPL